MALIKQNFKLENLSLEFYSFEHPVTGEIWVDGLSIAKSLGYENYSDAIYRNIKNTAFKKKWCELIKDFGSHNIKLPKNWQKKTTMINKDGIGCLVRNHKLKIPKTTIQKFSDFFKLDLKFVDRGTEQSYISAIKESFSFTQSISEFSIGLYRIDLYFPHEKIAIECDGNGHSNYNETDEYIRQSFIENALNCKFYRFNPDIEYFSIYKVISDLILLIMK